MRLQELAGAFMLLTRLPVSRMSRANPDPGACLWAYPVVGATVGALGAAVFASARLELPPVIAAILAVGAMILATGGLHEDGLADTADGFGGGYTRERKLEIMRDSRIGSYGALALMLSLALRVAALATLVEVKQAVAGLIVAGALSRGAILIPVLVLKPTRSSGLAALLATRSPRIAAVGLAIAVLFALPAPTALLGAGIAAAAMTMLARRQIGGYTGDVLGATQQMAECMALLGIFAHWS